MPRLSGLCSPYTHSIHTSPALLVMHHPPPQHVVLSQRNIIRRLLLQQRKPLDSGLITGHGNLHCPPLGHWFSLTVTHHPLQPRVCDDVILNNAEV